MAKKIDPYEEHVKLVLESVDEISKMQSSLPKAFIAPDVVLQIFQGEEKSKNILLKSEGKMKLVTSDFALYEAVSCLTHEELDLNILKDFLYRVEIIPSQKIKIDMNRIDHLRESKNSEAKA